MMTSSEDGPEIEVPRWDTDPEHEREGCKRRSEKNVNNFQTRKLKHLKSITPFSSYYGSHTRMWHRQ